MTTKSTQPNDAPALQAVLLQQHDRGFVVDGRHYSPETARSAAWYCAIPADDRLTVDAWLGIWARKAVH